MFVFNEFMALLTVGDIRANITESVAMGIYPITILNTLEEGGNT